MKTSGKVPDRTDSTTPTQRMYDGDKSKHIFLARQLELNFTKNMVLVIHCPRRTEFRRLHFHHQTSGCYPLEGRSKAFPRAEYSSPVCMSHRAPVLQPTVDLQSKRSSYWPKDRRGSRGRRRGKREAAEKKERKSGKGREKSDMARCVPAGRRRASVTNTDSPITHARFPANHSVMASQRS